MHATGALVGIAMTLVLAGCACDCDVEAVVGTRAGPGGMECGFVRLGEDLAPTVDCLESAIAEGRPAYGGWQSQGIDSEVWTYVAGHDESFALFGYGGAYSGQCATLVETPCESLPTRFSDASGRIVLSCPSSETRPICGR